MAHVKYDMRELAREEQNNTVTAETSSGIRCQSQKEEEMATHSFRRLSSLRAFLPGCLAVPFPGLLFL